ncbi:MAG: hypothetical protein PHD81_03965 [Candidatus Nanoarchaeia archaeon]|nr:hypothetical protein [Candidatus Nanoarchaeia archaeon]MDD5588237.1 hypothetical protein [Candidatus Nanoarchaeia archaeon]
MSVFSLIKRLFGKKEVPLGQFPEQPSFTATEPLASPMPSMGSSDNNEIIRTKLDLINAKIDNLDRKVTDIERMLTEK